MNDSKNEMFINDGSKDDPRERKANEFAATLLIPPDRDGEVAALKSKAAVIALANELGIAPGIVVGRYHHLTRKWNWFNNLKRRLVWVADEEAD